MLYKSIGEMIPGLNLSVYEYYTECYDIQNRILEDPIVVYSYKGITVLGFESKTKPNIEESSFKNDTYKSKKYFQLLKKNKFYFTVWYENNNPEELYTEETVFTTLQELKGFMNQLLLSKGDKKNG